MNITPGRRQFTISRKPWPAPDDWCAIRLTHGYTLQHHPELRVAREDVPGGSRLTLGHSFSAPGKVLGGRFVTIERELVRLDACGLLALLYVKGGDGFTITSSPAIACQAFGATPADRKLPRRGMNWHPSPGSPVNGWARLLADQTLDLASDEVRTCPKTLATDLSEQQAAEDLLSGLIESVSAMHSHFARTLLPLTAGIDSRTLFSALCTSGVAFETFTYVFDDASRQDAQTARELARRHGVLHHAIAGFERRGEYANALHRHQLESVCDTDVATLFPVGVYSHLKQHDLVLRGGLFELGRCDYLGRLWGIEDTDPRVRAGEIVARFDDDPSGPLLAPLEQWLAHRQRNPIGLDLADSFYFDQDGGAWLASIEQGLDSVPGTSVHPMNSLSLLRCLMSTSPRRRRQGCVQRRLIASVDAVLDRIPYNPAQLRDRLTGTPLEYGYYWLRSMFQR